MKHAAHFYATYGSNVRIFLPNSLEHIRFYFLSRHPFFLVPHKGLHSELTFFFIILTYGFTFCAFPNSFRRLDTNKPRLVAECDLYSVEKTPASPSEFFVLLSQLFAAARPAFFTALQSSPHGRQNWPEFFLKSNSKNLSSYKARATSESMIKYLALRATAVTANTRERPKVPKNQYVLKFNWMQVCVSWHRWDCTAWVANQTLRSPDLSVSVYRRHHVHTCSCRRIHHSAL